LQNFPFGGKVAIVFPFKGYRYSKELVGDFADVVTQPYDKTTPEMQDAYYQRSPYNVVRVTLNIEKREAPETDYTAAGSALRQWIEHKVLTQDPLPSIYAYYQEYEFDGATKLQKGFISLLDLKNSGSGIIPHERTLAAPKQDRLQLMRSIEANEDLIYMLYSDDRMTVNRVMDESISGRAPDIEITDEYGATHRLWAVTNPDAIRTIRDSMHPQKLFIADGHHRFETSVNFMKECEQKQWQPAGIESFDKRMIACFNIADGVTILPTHRLIRDLPEFDARSFLREAEKHFSIEPANSPSDLWKKMKEGRKDHIFGFYAADLRTFFLLRLNKNAQEGMDEFRRLDVSILHSLLLERCLGIDASKLESQAHVDYERERDTSIRLVDERKYQAAFFLNPTSAEQMQRISLLGQRMPQKSTDFYPKLLTGLVFMKMTIRK
jgi:uncharacterized protein (DUF1015 family)